MSGDVQPRKRRDKRRKRDALDRKSEGELSFVRQDSLQEEDEASHGVHITKMGSDDVHLHVQEDHGTGGHWCAKLFFFMLLVVLLGLIGLIIMENRGLSDLDTPLSESRFSNYFDGWVEESRHDDHDAVEASIEEHDEHDEPFEEVEDHSELDENGDHDDDDDDDHDEQEQDEDDEHNEDEQEEEPQTAENDEDEEEQEDNDTKDDNDEDEKSAEENQIYEDQDDDEDAADEDNNNDENATEENEDVVSEENDNNNEDDEDENDDDDQPTYAKKSSKNNDVDDDDVDGDDDEDDKDAFDEDEDEDDGDGIYDKHRVVDNDAEELLLLKQKARQQAPNQADQNSAEKEDDEEAEEDGNDNDNENENEASEEKNANHAGSSWVSGHVKSNSGGPKSYDDIDSFERELHEANEEMMRERYENAISAFQRLSEKYLHKPEAAINEARALDEVASKLKSNRILEDALKAYQRYLAFGGAISDAEFREAAVRCIERMRFMGWHMKTLPIHRQLMQRFNNEAEPRNQLAVSFLLMNRMSEAKQILQETLRLWPQDGFALVHYGFILKQLDSDYAGAVAYLSRGLATKAAGTQDGRFYFNLGDALQRLSRQKEALKVYEEAATLGLFPSVYQRSLYNEPNLRAQPFWQISETRYARHLERLKNNWQAIRDEGLNLLSKEGYFQDEAENLRQQGDWKQFELFARGQQVRKNCQKAPITCNLLAHFEAASGCRRGQIKFSVMHGGTHVWPHCGPTNCRLRAHLGLVVPEGTRLRVAEEHRTWIKGDFLIFDDSFEHEVWHEGNGTRLVLIVDVWHPDLSPEQRRRLTAI